MTTETQNRITELTTLGFTITTSEPRGEVETKNKDRDWPNIAFDVEIFFNGKLVLKTPYKLGIGYVKPVQTRPRQPLFTGDEESLFFAWKANPSANFKDKALQARVAARLAKTQGIKPELDDVLRSLLMDGEAFFNAQSFEDWAGDLGYDKDSRSEEAVYRACDAIGRKLAAAIPAEVLAKAREITQDI